MPTAGELSAILEAAYKAFARLHAARRFGRPAEVLTRDADTFVGMLAELGHDGEGAFLDASCGRSRTSGSTAPGSRPHG